MHNWSRPARFYSRPERLADAVVHVLGILFAINASLWLLAHVAGLDVVVSVTVYCLGLLAMTGFSAAYNLMPHHRPSKQMLRRFDHAAIFIMIAATYTPLAVGRLSAPTGEWILAAIWLTAGFGVIILLARKGFESDRLDELKGLNERSPWFAAVMLTVMFGMAGAAPFGGFLATLY